MNQEYITSSAEETKDLGLRLAAELKSGTVLALRGDLGAGKTTFSQGLLTGLGIPGPHNSPTFVVMMQYDVSHASPYGMKRVYHADAYRIGSKEMLNVGWEEWLADKEGLVLLEWPERVADILPARMQTITFEWLDETRRKIRLENF